MRKMLQDLSSQVLSISGADPFTPDLQDRLAYKLLVRRGYAELSSARSASSSSQKTWRRNGRFSQP